MDRNGVQLAIGRRATTVYANQSTSLTRGPQRSRPEKALRIDPDKLYGPLADQSRNRLRRAQGRRKAGRRAAAEGVQGLGFYSRGAARIRGLRRGPCPRIRGGGQQRPVRAGLALNETLAGRPGRETVVRDPFGRALDILKATPAVEAVMSA